MLLCHPDVGLDGILKRKPEIRGQVKALIGGTDIKDVAVLSQDGHQTMSVARGLGIEGLRNVR